MKKELMHINQPYNDIFTCARHLITLKYNDHAIGQAAKDFLAYIDLNAEIRKAVFQFMPAFNNRANNESSPLIIKNPAEGERLSSEMLEYLMQSAVYVIAIYDKSMGQTEKLVFIEEAVKNNYRNIHLRAAYQKLTDALSRIFAAKFAIIQQDNQKKLVPVLTYHPTTSRRKSIDAHLSYISITRDDYANRIYMPDKVSFEDERMCMEVFMGFIEVYSRIEKWKGPIIQSLIKAAYHIVKTFSRQNILFLQKQFTRICGKDITNAYWETFENASHWQAVIDYMDEFLSATEQKEICDFCAFLLILVLWYGGGNLMQEALRRKMQRLRNKYKDSTLLRKMGTFLAPIDFTFILNENGLCESEDEHNAILKTMKAVNPDTKIQPLVGTIGWVQDSFAWLDGNFELSLQFINPKNSTVSGRGLMSEGGNIVAGAARGKFILVSEGAVGGEVLIASLYVEAKKRGINVYALPGGFTWARNMRTDEDIALDSTHIDTVINAVSAECTTCGRTKIIIDPYYYRVIKNTPEFKRFIKEQDIKADDIVAIDKRELYLNLANFGVILDREGKKKLFFNKDKGYTLPRLNLKADILIQPDSEIVNISAFNGNIRCVTNMFSRAQVKLADSLLIIPESSLPKDIEKAVINFFIDKKNLVKNLLKVWVSILHIRHRFQKSSYEFDDLSRMGFITLGHNEGHDSEAACRFIETSIRGLCMRLGRKMGISAHIPQTDDYVVIRPPDTSAALETGYFIKAPTGELIEVR